MPDFAARCGVLRDRIFPGRPAGAIVPDTPGGLASPAFFNCPSGLTTVPIISSTDCIVKEERRRLEVLVDPI
jgi:hypothetical protein